MKRKILHIILLLSFFAGGFFFLLPAKAYKVEYRKCCVCIITDTSGLGTDDVYALPGGTTVDNIITDAEACNSHDAWSVNCEIMTHEECGTLMADETKLEDEFKLKDVVLGVTIPNLHFSAPPTKIDAEGNIYIPWLAEYIKALYNFSVAIISIVAVVMIIVAGAQIVASGGGPAKTQGYKRISQAIIGLLIAWGSYVVMYTINPNLTTLGALKVKYIEEEIIEFEANNIGLSNESASVPSNPALEKVAMAVADKIGINGCLFATQIAKESGWKVSNSTGCCHGLGQIMLSNAKNMLNKKRATIVNLHSQGCPNCPQAGATDQQVIAWLNSDAEGNLILAAMIKKNALKGAANPVAAAAVYGMGLASWKSYVTRTGCTPEKFDELQLLDMLKKNVISEEIIKKSCIPPVTWPLANQKRGFDCPPKTENNTTTIGYCCKTSSGDCEQPAFSPSGRIGVCQGGERDGQSCAAVAGGETYIKHYLNSIKRCAK